MDDPLTRVQQRFFQSIFKIEGFVKGSPTDALHEGIQILATLPWSVAVSL